MSSADRQPFVGGIITLSTGEKPRQSRRSHRSIDILTTRLWDTTGKAYGVPISQVVGGAARDSLRLYTHVGIYQPERMIEDAQRDVADGFTAMKPGAWAGSAGVPGAERIAAFAGRIGSLRQTVGPFIGIMVDDHGRGQPSNAVRLMHALEPFGLVFYEEPTRRDDVEGLQRLRLADPQMDLATGNGSIPSGTTDGFWRDGSST